MEMRGFYEVLLAPVITNYGPFDLDTLIAIVGFDAGGPISLLTIGRSHGDDFVTYVTCELAIREDQVPSEAGRAVHAESPHGRSPCGRSLSA